MRWLETCKKKQWNNMVQLKLKWFYILTQLEQSICLQDRYFREILFQLQGNCLQSAVLHSSLFNSEVANQFSPKLIQFRIRIEFLFFLTKLQRKLKKIFQWTSRSLFSSILFFLFWLCWCTICTFNGEIVWCTSHCYCNCPKERFFIRLVALKSEAA